MSGAKARDAMPTAVSDMAINAASSSPVRFASIGVNRPDTANIAGGSIPTKPTTVDPNCRSAPIRPNNGLIEVTAARSVNAERTIAANTSARPPSKRRESARSSVSVAAMALTGKS